MTIEDVKTYLRVDSDVDNDLITTLMQVAEGYVKDAVTDYDAKAANPAFAIKSEMCQRTLIAEMYENRNVGSKEAKDFSYIVRSMITQMQYMPIAQKRSRRR